MICRSCTFIAHFTYMAICRIFLHQLRGYLFSFVYILMYISENVIYIAYMFGIPLEELKVADEREIWDSLLRLLPP